MSVTIKQQPQDYTPAYNEQTFVALSTQTASANFVYTIVITDVLSSTSKTYQVAKRPDNYCVFDAAPFVQSFFTEHTLPKNEYGWQQCVGIRLISVNIGETYGSTPIYVAGTSISYKVWNGRLEYEDWPTYDKDNFVYANANYIYLSSLHNDITYPDRSNYLYALTSLAGDIEQINIVTYDSSGTVIGQSEIVNPHVASSTYNEKYLCIDVGHKGLTNISSGDVTGTYPILTSSVAYYDVADAKFVVSPPSWTVETLKTFTIGCEPKHDVYTVHFRAKSGAFETIHFSKRSEVDVSVNKDYWKKLPHEFDSVAETYGYDPSTPMDRVLSSVKTERLRLNTDWLGESQITLYQQIIDSHDVYLDLGSSTHYRPLKVISNSYRLNKRWNEKLFQIAIDFELAYYK